MKWNIQSFKCLPKIPILYTLERTRAIVHASPTEITQRITSYLRALSLGAIFDNERATALIHSADGTEFYVRLWQGNNDSPAKLGIVVEAQKKRGCPLLFHRTARDVVRAAMGINMTMPKPSGVTTSCRRPLSLASIKRQQQHLSNPTNKARAREDMHFALESAGCLLKKDRVDANLLGIDSLILLTDEESAGAEKAFCAARALLSSEPSSEGIKERMVELILPKKRDEFDQIDADAIRCRALTVLANSFYLLAREVGPNVCSILRDNAWHKETGFLSSLVEELDCAGKRTHSAYQATRCLNALMRTSIETSIEIKRKVVELGGAYKIAKSQGVGHCCHALLASECDAALECLDSLK